ncbi:FadR family transcriptional regulator [Streptomyces sp. S3(2020)]|uniref:FadR/GntR family transcriptional regulator n=1 Tax=Streptomyces sp. S3(2020) TaxID=2732044 RepID=UPI001488D0BC|nr:FCD domain-containing protein [Streptomyces sp. S3(2020)]NNN30744.1 FadR family transcriptional regulator [Streptomyces sp. S3(2020)]
MAGAAKAARPVPQDGSVTFGRARSTGSVVDAVVEQVERTITERQLPAGFRFGTKHELCEQFDIAPATLGEALRVLRGRGVIEARPGPGGGLFVTERSPLLRLAHSVMQLREQGATVNQMVAVLDALDESVVSDAAAHRTDADLQDLDELMEQVSKVWHKPVDGLRANWRLHRRIAEISPNPVLRAFYLNLVDYIEGELADGGPGQASLEVPGFDAGSADRLDMHRALVEAIRDGDQDQVRSAVLRHRTLGRPLTPGQRPSC